MHQNSKGFFLSHFKKHLQNVIFAIPQKRKIIHAYNNVSSINNVYLILHVAFLTYMIDREIFFEWLVKVKVLHRLQKKRRERLVHWTAFWNHHDHCHWSVLIVVIILHLFTLIRFKHFLQSQDRETEGHTELKRWTDHHSDIQSFTDHLKMGKIGVSWNKSNLTEHSYNRVSNPNDLSLYSSNLTVLKW